MEEAAPFVLPIEENGFYISSSLNVNPFLNHRDVREYTPYILSTQLNVQVWLEPPLFLNWDQDNASVKTVYNLRVNHIIGCVPRTSTPGNDNRVKLPISFPEVTPVEVRAWFDNISSDLKLRELRLV